MKQHKWHKEIKAWAETGEIDWRLNSDDDWQPLKFPAWHEDDGEYRIKPQPKEPRYIYAWLIKDSEQIEFYNDKPEGVVNDDWHEYIGKIKLEVDDEL